MQLYCVWCGHEEHDHIKIHKVRKNQIYKCKKCKCYDNTDFSKNGNTWRLENVA